MRLPVLSYRRRAEWTRPYPCDTVLDERYVRTSVVVVCAQNCTVNTQHLAPLSHTPPSRYTFRYILLYDRAGPPTPRNAHSLARPLHRTLKSLPEDTPRTQRPHTTSTNTHNHTRLSVLSAPPPLFTRAPLLSSARSASLVVFGLHPSHPLYTAHSSFVPSSESQPLHPNSHRVRRRAGRTPGAGTLLP